MHSAYSFIENKSKQKNLNIVSQCCQQYICNTYGMVTSDPEVLVIGCS